MGVIGQALAFVTLFIPAFTGHLEILPNLVIISAVSAILIPTTTLAAQVRLPILPSRSMLKNSRNVVISIGSTVSLLLVSAICLISWSMEISTILFSMAVTHLGHSAYIFMNALLVRSGLIREIAILRFSYSFVTLLFTLIATLVLPSTLGFSLAIGSGFLVGMVFTLIRVRRTMRRLIVTNADCRDESANSIGSLLQVIVIQTMASIIHQAFALVTPLLGNFAIAWSLVLRFVNGLETFGGVILGPILDAEFISHRTSGDLERVVQIIRKTISLGTILGLVAAVSVPIFDFLRLLALVQHSSDSRLLVMLTMSLFAFGHVAVAPIGRIVYFLNGNKLKFWSECVRAIFVISAVFAGVAEAKLVFLSIGSIAAASLTLLWVSVYAGRIKF
jgi:hypothetical protein